MKNLFRLLAGEIVSSESILSLTPLCSHFVNWKIYLLVSDCKKRHYEQHQSNYSIPHKLTHSRKYRDRPYFLIFKIFILNIYIQIASNNHNKPIKTFTVLEIKVFQGAWRIAVKDDITLKFLWYLEIRKQHSSLVKLLCVYPFKWHCDINSSQTR